MLIIYRLFFALLNNDISLSHISHTNTNTNIFYFILSSSFITTAQSFSTLKDIAFICFPCENLLQIYYGRRYKKKNLTFPIGISQFNKPNFNCSCHEYEKYSRFQKFLHNKFKRKKQNTLKSATWNIPKTAATYTVVRQYMFETS